MNTKTNKKEKQEQALVPVHGEAEVLISKAIDKNVSVESLERLLAMRRELKQEWAKEQYDKAMSEFQADCPIIEKTKGVKTKSGIIAYRYAPIESIVDQVKEFLQKHGFSYSTNMELIENGTTKVKVSIKVTHFAGHSETTDMTVPLGNKTDIMSQTQVVAAAQTFAKRYAFCNAFGILTGDEDNDTNSIPVSEKKPNKVENGQAVVTGEYGVCSAHDKPVKMFRGVSKSKVDSNGNPKVYWWHKDANGDMCFGYGVKTQTKVSNARCDVCHAPMEKLHASNCPVVKELEVDVDMSDPAINEMRNERRASS